MSLAARPSHHRRRKDAASSGSSQVHIPERFKLSNSQKKHYATVAELKPDWTEDEIVDFCRKCEFNSTIIHEGLANAFEDSRLHKEVCDNDWNTVDKKPRKPVVVEGEKPRYNKKDNNNREAREARKQREQHTPAPQAPVVAAEVAPADARAEAVEESAAPAVVAGESVSADSNVDNNGVAPASLDNNQKPLRSQNERRQRTHPKKDGPASHSKEQRRPRWKRQAKPEGAAEGPVAAEKPSIQEKKPESIQAPAAQTVPVVSSNSREGAPKPTYAGLLKRLSAPSVPVVPVVESAPAAETKHESSVSEEVISEVIVSEAPVVVDQEGLETSPVVVESVVEEIPVIEVSPVVESLVVEAAPVESSVAPEESAASQASEPARVAIIEESDAYLPATTKSTASHPTPIGPTPKKHSQHAQVPSIKSSAPRSVWRVKETPAPSTVSQSSSSTPTPPPSPSERLEVSTQIPNAAATISDTKLYEQSQEIIKDISARAIQKVESVSEEKGQLESSNSTFEFGFGLTGGSSNPSFSAISESVVSLPHEVEPIENVVESQQIEEEVEANSQMEGFENELTDEMFGHLDSAYDFASQHLSVPAQYAGYHRGVPGVVPTSPYMMHAPGAVPAPYFMMAYEPDGTPSHPAAMNPNFYDPYAQRRGSGRNQARPAPRHGAGKQGANSASLPNSRQSGPPTNSSYRPKPGNQRNSRSDRRDGRGKDTDQAHSNGFSDAPGLSVPSGNQGPKDSSRIGNSGAIGAKRQGNVQRGNYVQNPHQVPGPMVYGYPYAMPYSHQYAPVPFPGYVYGPGAPYNYMYPQAPMPGSQAAGFDEELNGAGYAVPEQVAAPVDPHAPRAVAGGPAAGPHESVRVHPGSYPHQVHPLPMFDAAASWQHHPEMLNDPNVAAAAAADYSMMHMMNAPSGYMDYPNVGMGNVSGSNAGYDTRDYRSGSPSYYRISPFQNANASGSSSGSNNGSTEQPQPHHGHAPLSFQQWNHQSQ
jgi:hypothetical protein